MSERYNNMKEINNYRVDTIPYYYIAEIVKTNHPLYGKKVKIDNFRIADTTYKILHLDWREAVKSHVEKINTSNRKEQLFTQGKGGEG